MPDELTNTIRGPEDVVAFLHACEVPPTDRAQIVLGLARAEFDPLAHVVCGAAVRSGADGDRPIDADQLIGLAEELLVCSLVIATVEPGAARIPSRAETRQFVALRCACADERVVLLDWVVVARNHWWSLREQVIHEAA